jgi:D-beta-D-heptose 7-phosphate kinase/D-beta-D-heptose 1-phosphate adenosyltransferase
LSKNNRAVVLVSGGFDPVHSGHIEYLKSAKRLSNYLIVGLNSDEWLIRKKQLYFMSWSERAEIIKNFSIVDKVIAFNDDDESATDAIKICLSEFEEVIFANGGDRGSHNCAEHKIYGKNPKVHFKFGIGGTNKINSSSWIVEDFLYRYKQVKNIKSAKE